MHVVYILYIKQHILVQSKRIFRGKKLYYEIAAILLMERYVNHVFYRL